MKSHSGPVPGSLSGLYIAAENEERAVHHLVPPSCRPQHLITQIFGTFGAQTFGRCLKASQSHRQDKSLGTGCSCLGEEEKWDGDLETSPGNSKRSSTGRAGATKAEAPGWEREVGTERVRDKGRERSMFVPS